MRIRSTQRPPTRETIDRMVREGASADDKTRSPRFLRRLQQAFILDKEFRTMSARERLVQQYKKDGLVLFLGAGISCGSKIPSWPKLANKVLLKSSISQEELGTIKKALPSFIAQFELARQILGSDKNLVEVIYEALYQAASCRSLLKAIPPKYEDQIGWSGWENVRAALEVNKTLRAVGELLINEHGGQPKRNPQIHAVLTVNADNLLELFCEARTAGRRIVTMVDRASVGDHPDQTPVYHLHGTLDARRENLFRPCPTSVPSSEVQEVTDELLPDLVFCESEYYETIANPSSYVNHTPQSILRRLNALFIGTSLDDLNMRRWLYDSFQERVRHRTRYLREFYGRHYPDAEYEARLESIRHYWLRPEVEYDEAGIAWAVPKKHLESVMGNLGVQIVWCADYEDMQRFISEMQNHGYDPEFGRRTAEYPG